MRYKTFELYSQSYKGLDLPAVYARISSEREIYWLDEINKSLNVKTKSIAKGMHITGKTPIAGKDNYSFIQLLVSEDSEWFNFDILYKNLKFRSTDALVNLCKIVGWT